MIEFYYDEERTKRENAEYNQEIGDIRTLKKSILRILSAKGSISSELKSYIQNQENYNILDNWLTLSINSATLSDFNRTIGFAS